MRKYIIPYKPFITEQPIKELELENLLPMLYREEMKPIKYYERGILVTNLFGDDKI